MKTGLYAIILGVFLTLNFSGFSQDKEESYENHHCLFEEKSFMIGAGVPFAFNLNAFGINTRLYYNIGEALCFGPEFSYFNKGDESLYDVNFVGHYIFETKIVGIYPLIGANYSKETSSHGSEEAYGGVFGLGIHRNFGLLTIFTEYTHVESRLRDDFITAGVLINLKRNRSH